MVDARRPALFSGHRRGVDVGVTQLEQWQTPTVSVSIPVWIWLAALSVEGGRVVVGSAAAANLLLGGRRGLGGDDVGVVPAVYSAGGIRGGYPGMGPGKMTP